MHGKSFDGEEPKIEDPRRIFVVRHGTTGSNLEELIAGQSNSPLTIIYPQGITESVDAGLKLKMQLGSSVLAGVFASPLDRTLSTAQIICGIVGYDHHQIIKSDRLRELDAGAFSMLSREDVKKKHPDFYNDPDFKIPGSLDTQRKMYARAGYFLMFEAIPRSAEGPVLVSCHNGTLRSFHAFVEQMPLEEMMRRYYTDGEIKYRNGFLGLISVYEDRLDFKEIK